jgi:hypothetical protein
VATRMGAGGHGSRWCWAQRPLFNGPLLGVEGLAWAGQTAARVNVTWVTPLGEEVASIW